MAFIPYILLKYDIFPRVEKLEESKKSVMRRVLNLVEWHNKRFVSFKLCFGFPTWFITKFLNGNKKLNQ